LELVKETIPTPGQLAFIRQQEPLGLGHAVWCARHFAGEEPVAVLLADDLILNTPGCLRQMVDAYAQVGGNMIATMEVAPEQTASYGVIDAGKSSGQLIEVRGLVEKPKPADAPSNLAVIGRYIIQPNIFNDLARMEQGAGGEIQLTDALARQVGKTPFHGFRFEGKRFDCGSKVGFLEANIAYAMNRVDMAPQVQDIINTFVKG
jgi:UTP--glucose-1-phosphate uridylyltransferase